MLALYNHKLFILKSLYHPQKFRPQNWFMKWCFHSKTRPKAAMSIIFAANHLDYYNLSYQYWNTVLILKMRRPLSPNTKAGDTIVTTRPHTYRYSLESASGIHNLEGETWAAENNWNSATLQPERDTRKKRYTNKKAALQSEGVNKYNADCFLWHIERGKRLPIPGL